MLKKTGRWILFILFIFTTFSLSANSPMVTISVEKRKVMKETPLTVQFQLNADEEADRTPIWDLSDHNIDVEFQMMVPNRSRSVTIINGHRTEVKESRFTYTYKIICHDLGFQSIEGPTFEVDGQKIPSGSFRIEVTEIEKNPYYSLSMSELPSQIFVGERLDFDLYFSFQQSVKSPEFTIEGLTKVKHQLRSREKFTDPIQILLNNEVVEGEEIVYNGAQTLRIPLSLIVQEPSTIDFSKTAIRFRGVPVNAQRGFWGAFEEEELIIQLEEQNSPLNVLSLPAKGRPKNFSGLVGKMELAVSADPVSVKVGDPITLTICVSNINDYQFEFPPLSTDPSFSKNFTIPATQAPGRMEEGKKVWRQTLRPLNEGNFDIPSLHLDYFDTRKGQYTSVVSKPIPISVEKAVILETDQLIFNATVPKELADSYQNSRQFHNLSLEGLSHQDLRQPLQSFSPGMIAFIVILLLILLLEFILILLFKFGVIGQAHHHKLSSFEKILRSTSLNEKGLFESLSQCRSQILALPEDHTDFLVQLDEVMFHHQLSRSEVEALFKSTLAGEKKKKGAKTAGSILFLALLPFCFLTNCSASVNSDLSIDQIDAALTQGSDAFNEGMALILSHEKSPIASFQEAYQQWSYLAENGVVDDRLQFNLGNCARFLNDDVSALIHYKKALLIRDKKIYREAIQSVMEKNGFSEQESATERFFSEVAHAFNGTTLALKVVLTLFFIILLVAILVISHLYKIKHEKGFVLFPLLETLLVLSICILIFAFFMQLSLPGPGEEGVVVESVEGRYGDSYAYETAFSNALSEGQLFNLLEVRKGWLYIELPNGLKCWIPEKTAQLIE